VAHSATAAEPGSERRNATSSSENPYDKTQDRLVPVIITL
jgi:hypothetical protein